MRTGIIFGVVCVFLASMAQAKEGKPVTQSDQDDFSAYKAIKEANAVQAASHSNAGGRDFGGTLRNTAFQAARGNDIGDLVSGAGGVVAGPGQGVVLPSQLSGEGEPDEDEHTGDEYTANEDEPDEAEREAPEQKHDEPAEHPKGRKKGRRGTSRKAYKADTSSGSTNQGNVIPVAELQTVTGAAGLGHMVQI
ncbi:hypothetical protein EC973_000079 [Apophysomyces ossiformis]|uniref:Uncharacterized protein n=1 Tax=Apophysomyces ossiformis TaxID=679940 RepID=A0A8H7EVK3_9FUNG|nr:hypothetical protein EC973_000079 [Apophysomyces ossiformis]